MSYCDYAMGNPLHAPYHDEEYGFPIHDDDAARALGLKATPTPAPWPLLAALPCGPELNRQQASVTRDVIAAAPP